MQIRNKHGACFLFCCIFTGLYRSIGAQSKIEEFILISMNIVNLADIFLILRTTQNNDIF